MVEDSNLNGLASDKQSEPLAGDTACTAIMLAPEPPQEVWAGIMPAIAHLAAFAFVCATALRVTSDHTLQVAFAPERGAAFTGMRAALIGAAISLVTRTQLNGRLGVSEGASDAILTMGAYQFPALLALPWEPALLTFLLFIRYVATGLLEIGSHGRSFLTALGNAAHDTAIRASLLALVFAALMHLGVMGVATALPHPEPSPFDDMEWTAWAVRDIVEPYTPSSVSASDVANALHRIAHSEASALGILDLDPYVSLRSMSYDTLGGYIQVTNTICVNAELPFMPRQERLRAVGTVIHAMAHAYQQALITGTITSSETSSFGYVDKNTLEEWRKELELYPTLSPGDRQDLSLEKAALDYEQRRMALWMEAAFPQDS